MSDNYYDVVLMKLNGYKINKKLSELKCVH